MPLAKSALILNGNELNSSAYDETLGASKDASTDVWFARKTVFWTGYDACGSPWDEAWVQYVKDRAAAGTDIILQGTGFDEDQTGWWKWWESVGKFGTNQNSGWLHINRASRFFQSARVTSLGVLAPLKLTDIATGVQSSADGRPMTGQLLLSLDNQVNILSRAQVQVETTKSGELKAVYQNQTGKQVYISSIILQVVYQLNATGLLPTVGNNAKITVGTQAGGYRNIIGTFNPDSVQQDGVETKLYLTKQVKELFPDSRDSYVAISPFEQVFVRVDSPAGAPIEKQIVSVIIKGHVL